MLDMQPRDYQWSRKEFRANQVGHSLFPETMEGRWRTRNTVDRPLNAPLSGGAVIRNKLAELQVTTLHDLFSLDKRRYDQLTRSDYSPDYHRFALDAYANRIAKGDGAFIDYVFRLVDAQPLPPALEPARAVAIQSVLDTLSNPTEVDVVLLHLGLYDGLKKSPKQVGEQLGLASRRAELTFDKAIRKVSRREVAAPLLPYITFPVDSIGAVYLNMNSFHEYRERFGHLPTQPSPVNPMRIVGLDLVMSVGQVGLAALPRILEVAEE